MSSDAGEALKARSQVAVGEIAAALGHLDDADLEALIARLLQANRIFLSGQGRSGLMLRAIGVRLMHIGLCIFVAGESNTPAIGPGDLLIAVSSSARTATTLEHLAVARRAGAETALITAVAAGDDLADCRLWLPVRCKVATVQHAGSLFEQSVLVLGDCLAWYVQQAKAVGDDALSARHANLQ